MANSDSELESDFQSVSLASSSWCIFCLRNNAKLFSSDSDGENSESDNRTRLGQFIKLFWRYTGRGSENQYENFCQVFSSQTEKRSEGDEYYGACEDCSLVLQDFCDFYEKVKVLEMKLDWKLQTLKAIMCSADKVPFRSKMFQENLERKGSARRQDVFQTMKEFRKKFMKAASGKLNAAFPRVRIVDCQGHVLHRGDNHNHEVKEDDVMSSVAKKYFKSEQAPHGTKITGVGDHANLEIASDNDPSHEEHNHTAGSKKKESANTVKCIPKVESKLEDEKPIIKSELTISEPFVSKFERHDDESESYEDNDEPSIEDQLDSHVKQSFRCVTKRKCITDDEDIRNEESPPPRRKKTPCGIPPFSEISHNSFPSLKELAFQHIINVKFICNVPTCPSRAKFYFNRDDFLRHSLHHGDFPCIFCNAKMDYAPSLSAHEVVKHAGRVRGKKTSFRCPRCNFQANNISILKSHHLKSHLKLTPDRRTCGICGMVAKNRGSALEMAEEHYSVYHDLTGVDMKTIQKCGEPSCRAYFRTEDQLNQHLALIHKVASAIPLYRAGVRQLSLRNSPKSTEMEYHPQLGSRTRPGRSVTDTPANEESESSSDSNEALSAPVKRKKYKPKSFDWIGSLSLSQWALKKLSNRKYCTFGQCKHHFFCDEDLEAHRKLHGKFKCFACKVVMTSVKLLFRHERSCHPYKEEKSAEGKFDSCPRCEYSIASTDCWRSKAELMNHYLEAHFNLQVDHQTCPVCNVKLSNRFVSQKDCLRKHLSKTHNFSAKIYKCEEEPDFCEAYFNKKFLLVAHRNNHRGIENVSVSRIKRRLKKKKEITLSWIQALSLSPHAMEKMSNKISCNFGNCKQEFFSEEELEAHSKLHGKFKCQSESCGVVMTSVKELFRHEISSHSKKGVNKCPRCKHTTSCNKNPKAGLLNHYLKTHFNLEMDYHTCPLRKSGRS